MTEQKELPPTWAILEAAALHFERVTQWLTEEVNSATKAERVELCKFYAEQVRDAKQLPTRPAEDERIREVINFAAFWRGLYARHVNVEEGDYLRCLRCNGDSTYHGRGLDPKDVTHAERCPVAMAQELAKGPPPVQPAASTEAQDDERVLTTTDYAEQARQLVLNWQTNNKLYEIEQCQTGELAEWIAEFAFAARATSRRREGEENQGRPLRVKSYD